MLKALLLLFLSTTAFCQINSDWRGLTAAKSTRADVERVLGPPEDIGGTKYATFYSLKDGRAFVRYASGSCQNTPKTGWNLPENTVIEIAHYPNIQPTLESLGLDLRKFEHHPDPGSLNLSSYVNEKDGTVLTVDDDNTVVCITHFPDSKYAHLKCKELKD